MPMRDYRVGAAVACWTAGASGDTVADVIARGAGRVAASAMAPPSSFAQQS